jgi:diketogulonate reductase-like aldo/keto reductase
VTLRRWTLRRQCRENEHDDPYDVGLGTAQVFNTNDDATRQKARAVLQALTAAGGGLVDTASVYGDAETVVCGEGAGQEEIIDRHDNLTVARAIYRGRVSQYPGPSGHAVR